MTSLLLICVGMMAVAAMTAIATMAMTATGPVTETAIVSPFDQIGGQCPANDTLVAGLDTVMNVPHARNWQMATLKSLTEVETLLDTLENHNITDRELHVLADSAFVVRWKLAVA